MSTKIGTFTTAHLPAATGPHGQPLPLRERTYGACSGHCVCAMDWAVLSEMMLERSIPEATYAQTLSLDVYPHQNDYSVTGPWDLEGLVQSQLFSAMDKYLDPSWTPQDIDNGWYLFTNTDLNPPVGRLQYMFSPSSRQFRIDLENGTSDKHTNGSNGRGYPRTPRTLDDMRRLYYDAKMMYRVDTDCPITYDGINHVFYERYYGGAEYGEGPESITLGSEIRSISNRVQRTSGFGVRSQSGGHNAFAMVEMWCDLNHPAVYRSSCHKKTLCIPCSLGSELDMIRFGPDQLKNWVKSVYGEFSTGNDYYAYARVSNVYADLNFPVDYFFTGWNYEPQGEQ